MSLRARGRGVVAAVNRRVIENASTASSRDGEYVYSTRLTPFTATTSARTPKGRGVPTTKSRLKWFDVSIFPRQGARPLARRSVENETEGLSARVAPLKGRWWLGLQPFTSPSAGGRQRSAGSEERLRHLHRAGRRRALRPRPPGQVCSTPTEGDPPRHAMRNR